MPMFPAFITLSTSYVHDLTLSLFSETICSTGFLSLRTWLEKQYVQMLLRLKIRKFKSELWPVLIYLDFLSFRFHSQLLWKIRTLSRRNRFYSKQKLPLYTLSTPTTFFLLLLVYEQELIQFRRLALTNACFYDNRAVYVVYKLID